LCSAFQAVMVFAKNIKAKTPPAFHFHICYLRPIGLLYLPPLLNSQRLRRASLSVAIQLHRQPICNLQAVFFAHGCYNLLFTTHKTKTGI
jgi:hypothetical protein